MPKIAMLAVSLLLIAPSTAGAADLPLPRQGGGEAQLQADMSALAREVLAQHPAVDAVVDLDSRFRLELVAGRFADAEADIGRLRAIPPATPDEAPQLASNNVQYLVHARAGRRAAASGRSIEAEFAPAFRDVVGPLNDIVSALVMRTLNVEQHGGLSLILVQPRLRQAVESDLATLSSQTSITVVDALKLVRDYQIRQSYDLIAPLVGALMEEDDARRYVVERDLLVPTPEGAKVCVQVMRPRSAKGPLPTLMTFTIYADPLVSASEARRSASHGYAAVTGYTRGKACSPDQAVPREHDGADAAAVIDWVSRQPWSDGRVGLYGGSYAGFTQWAAAKHRPKALKAMMPTVTLAPGINDPGEGGVADGSSFYWTHYTTDQKGLDGQAYDDSERWRRVFETWYRDGRAYADLAKIDGQPNPWFDKWLAHPDFDAYWQGMIPVGQEFAGIDIPVLTTTGYYDGGLVGSLYYFGQHHRYHPGARHYLLVGPYDHGSGNRGTVGLLGGHDASVGGLALDPVARMDLGVLRYQWFDHVFKGTPLPAILAEKVNFEVMGANTWRHAPSLEAMRPGSALYRFGAVADLKGVLTPDPKAGREARLMVDLADRSDAAVEPSEAVVDGKLDSCNGLVFETRPFTAPTEISGLFKARLRAIANKRDFDFSLRLYEHTADGRYVRLSWAVQRASYAGDPTRRRLLTPGKPKTLSIVSPRVTSRIIQPGSRIVAVLAVVKGPEQQINYGTGKPVNLETVADAGAPLEVRWLADSTLDLPLSLKGQ